MNLRLLQIVLMINLPGMPSVGLSQGCREPGITETIITCKTGIRYNGIGHNGIRYIKTGIRYNAIRDNGIRYNGEQESVITLKGAIWNQV